MDFAPASPAPHSAPAPSLPESHASITVPRGGAWWRRFLAFAGPGYMISVGYMDPGNWATDIAGGSRFGYTLLSVVLLSNLVAVFLQALSARLGIATGLDLAQASRATYGRTANLLLWLGCELAIIACDLAEVIGTAIALKLLFGLPLILGALLTVGDTVLLLWLMQRGFRFLEAFIGALLALIAVCFAVQVALAAPPVAAVLAGFVPQVAVVTDPAMLYVAIGILGATVMPHNLYLHSSIVQTRAYERTERGRRDAIRWATLDSTVALTLALFVNAGILIVAASVFHASGHTEVVEIEQAHAMLAPLLGAGIASVLFAVALLASGLNSTVTATLAGQIVMEGFLDLRLPQWARRLVTRGLAVVPVIAVTWFYGEDGTGELLVLSQVILALQLPFAMIPLIRFVSDRGRMGVFAISRPVHVAAWAVTLLVLGLNAKLVFDSVMGGGG